MKSSKWLVALLAALGFVSLLPAMGWANGISVQVGYADDLRSNAFFPSNFCNGGTQFGGSSGATCSQVFLRRHPCRQQYRPNQERHGRSGYYRERDIRLMEYRGGFHGRGRHGRSSGSNIWTKLRHERLWECVCARQFDTADQKAYAFSWRRHVTVDHLHRFRASLEYRGI